MYEYLVVDYITGLRSEVEYFFNQSTWTVSAITDPQDPDPERYAILAVLPHYLVIAFNRLIERGLPRGSPAIITSAEEEERLRNQEVKLESEPEWTTHVPRLPNVLVIPTIEGDKPDDASQNRRFLDLNIIVGEPNVLFV
ncbi:hypothetical protein LIA77_04234 [Sarocladium implicatum]|nr:hypothetical protein LIA77_04234 [Sarocladium implicatum]